MVQTICPFTAGPAVYRARALYNTAYRSFTNFADNCLPYNANSARKGNFANPIKKSTLNSSFDAILFPNPSNGLINIAMVGLTEAKLEILITDMTGKYIYSGKVIVANGIGRLPIEAANGIYSVRIANTETNESTVKKLLISK